MIRKNAIGEKLRDQEDRNLRNNLRVDELKEYDEETEKDFEKQAVKELFMDKSKIEKDIEIEGIYRTGRRKLGKERTFYLILKTLKLRFPKWRLGEKFLSQIKVPKT